MFMHVCTHHAAISLTVQESISLTVQESISPSATPLSSHPDSCKIHSVHHQSV